MKATSFIQECKAELEKLTLANTPRGSEFYRCSPSYSIYLFPIFISFGFCIPETVKVVLGIRNIGKSSGRFFR